MDFIDGEYRFTATVNEARGGVAGLIRTISKA